MTASRTPRTPARSAFAGYSRAALTFLKQIAEHNERDWFQEHKTVYETDVRGGTARLVEALNAQLARFAPDYVTEVTAAIPRIYRDLRFTSDKRPYKEHVAAVFPRRGGRRGECASFYVSVSHGGVLVLAGVTRPESHFLHAIRARIAEDPKALSRLLRRKALRTCFGDGRVAHLDGPLLVNVPRGYDKQHPAADHLRHKQFCVRAALPRALAGKPTLLSTLVEHFRAAAPFVTWLDEIGGGGPGER